MRSPDVEAADLELSLVLLRAAITARTARPGAAPLWHCRSNGNPARIQGSIRRNRRRLGISVMVTRRLAAMKGSSGNSGSVSALPATS